MSDKDWKFALFREIREELCVPSHAYTVSDKLVCLPTERFTELEPQKIQLFILICHCKLLDDKTPILLNEENMEYSWETARDMYEKIDILGRVSFEEIFT